MKIRALIVDDEPLARQRVRLLLGEEPDVEVIGECEDGFEAVDQIQATRPDLVFLDVQMPDMDGFEVLRRVPRELLPVVIFTTAYDQHALRAFEVNALDSAENSIPQSAEVVQKQHSRERNPRHRTHAHGQCDACREHSSTNSGHEPANGRESISEMTP